MSSIAAVQTPSPNATSDVPQEPSKRLRASELALVLGVAFAAPLLSSAYVWIKGTGVSEAAGYQSLQLLTGISNQATALGLLAYVLYRQKRTFWDLSRAFEPRDILRSLAVLTLAYFAYTCVYYGTSYFSSFLGGNVPSNTTKLPFAVSALSIVFMCLNPVHEEVIVRAYAMNEVLGLTGSRWISVVFSTALQTCYHLYQGTFSALMLSSMFLVFSVYYLKTRRIGPVILAHLYLDLAALFSYGRS
jgi:membrane protease YdiL (CAAX protease family)